MFIATIRLLYSYLVIFETVIFCKGFQRINFPKHSPPSFRSLSIEDVVRTTNDDTCFTEEGEIGECISLFKCNEFVKFLQNTADINIKTELLRRRLCRTGNQNLYICCPKKLPASNITRVASCVPKSRYLPKKHECGYRMNSKVAMGKQVDRGAHPWLVSVGQEFGTGKFKHFCGGTLITKKHVLTAAHCFADGRLTHVTVGEHSLLTNSENPQPIVREIERTYLHHYNKTTRHNDIALVVMKEEVTFNDYRRPACLPFSCYVRGEPSPSMTVVGWGKKYLGQNNQTDTPNEAHLDLINKKFCQTKFRGLDLVIGEHQVCYGDKDKGKDACEGDSGGPLLKEDDRFYVFGVVAYGGRCGTSFQPGVYSFVPAYLQWIVDHIDAN